MANNTLSTILPIISNQTLANAVSGRALYAFLELGKDYATWAKAQVDRARLVEHRDFEVVFPQKGVNPQGGRPAVDYLFSIDSAKHISMMSGSDKGFEVREYFLECERQAIQALSKPALPQNYVEALECLVLAEKEKQTLACKVAELAPKAAALDILADSESLTGIRDASKELDMKLKDFSDWLIGKGWAFRQGGKLRPTEMARQEKLMDLVQIHGNGHIWPTARLTEKGMILLAAEVAERSVA